MEQEIFLSGYCRCMDAARMVEVLLIDGRLEEADSQFGSCPHEGNCPIAEQLRQYE